MFEKKCNRTKQNTQAKSGGEGEGERVREREKEQIATCEKERQNI